MGPSLKRIGAKPAGAGGFSLIEVALSLGIIGFALTALIGLLPLGLTSFRQAMRNTIESDIVQNLTNDILLSDFSNIYQYNAQAYYYDAEGLPLTDSKGAVYTATVTLQGVDSSNSPAALVNHGVSTNTVTANTSAYNVTITITNVTPPGQPHAYPLIVANNNQ